MKRLLIVDDDMLLSSNLIERIEEFNECEIRFVKSASNAIQLFDSMKFDIIILDMIMPVGTLDRAIELIGYEDEIFGIKLLAEFRSKDKDVAIFGYSVLDSPEISNAFKTSNGLYFCKLRSGSFDALCEKIGRLIN